MAEGLIRRWIFRSLFPENRRANADFRALQSRLALGIQAGGDHTASAGGATSSFTIPHGLDYVPDLIMVTPGSLDADGAFYSTADADNINIEYNSPPPSGTDNLTWHWMAGTTGQGEG